MKFSGFKRLTKEDVAQEFRQTLDVIANSFNPFAEEITRLVNGNLNQDNLNEKIKTFDVTVAATGIPIQSTQFKTDMNTRVEGMQVIYLQNLTNSSSYPSNAPFITFSENNRVITVNHVTGLTTGNKYRVKVKLIGT